MGTLLPLPKEAQPPIFGPYLLWPMAGWIKMPLSREVGLLAQTTLCYMGTHGSLPKKGAEPLNFWPMSIVAKLLGGSRCHIVRR